MDDLIARLEKATGPDRELDAEIARACGTEVMQGYPIGTDTDWLEAAKIKGGWYKLRSLTTSIDAALTLVPDNAGVELSRYWIRKQEAAVWSAGLFLGGVPGNPARDFEAMDAPTPAIAICIAVLKARAAITTAQGGGQ